MGELKPTAEIEELARRLAELEGRDVNDAVADALRGALAARAKGETPSQTAARILDKYGIKPGPNAAKPLAAPAHPDLETSV